MELTLNNVPKEVNVILRNSCFDCHSNTPNLSWYDKITPANFIVHSHINDARKVLNFSNWDSLPKPKQNAVLYYAFNKILSGEMPLPNYAALHPSAKLDDTSMKILKNYVNSIAVRKAVDKTANLVLLVKKENSNDELLITTISDYANIKPSLNKISYIPNFRHWKAVSTSDRFDNGTMRIIYGNDVAVDAIKQKKTNPWPDGTIFAKTAWKQKMGTDGNISPGEFIQVEFMIKDTKKYASTKGWGWARWKGNDLKPYGENANFDQECINCHKPVENYDYVFTMPLHLDVNKYKIYDKK
ncbi:cytochrome P460 family protein [Flavobacterium aquidurense]|uniref:cytochrome P460 family protein n=1 Tax=Flavobacterium aquidurense TaxID=362413 RepID=UPI003757B4FF